MTDRQLTDSEIIKALDCCKYDDCNNCPNVVDNCHANLIDYALDLINRQKAEIERLKEFIVETRRCDKELKAEAIREFAERLKKAFVLCDPMFNKYIDNLVKEMAGDSDE